jgi:hypothetical protein
MEQATDIQRQYNLISSKLAEHIRTHTHPKLVVYKQHQLPPGAYTNQPGEVLEIVGQPTLGPPFVLQPPNILNDIWRALELLDKQFDEVFQIYPVAEGQADTTNSGFQTNLLQEAVEGVHAPDIRLHELAIEDACVKLRRLAKLGYDVPRLIRTVGSNYQAEILEFSGSQIDEQADVMIEAGSALPFLKAAKQETVMNLFEKGLFGDPTQPEVKRRALSLLEMGSLEEAFDKSKIDEQKARLENQLSRDARPIPPPDLIDNHMIHLDEHAAEIKSPGFLAQAPERQVELRRHFVLHQNILDVNQALLLAQAWGFPDLAEQFQAQLMAQQQAMLQQAMMGLAPAPAPSAQAAPVAG